MENPKKIGKRIEMFVDEYLIESYENAALRLHSPERREKIFFMDQPWEGPGSGVYSVVFQDGDIFRMFYRATYPETGIRADHEDGQGCCYAESKDGINWTRPGLGIVKYEGRDTNIVFEKVLAHNFSPFLDENPDPTIPEKYKAVAGRGGFGMRGFKSSDCIHWEPINDSPLFTDGAFDSHNLAFYDTNYKKYVCYSRFFDPIHKSAPDDDGVRAIQYNYSDDFINWDSPRPNTYGENTPIEHLYTNATVQCPGAEHIYLSFPMRFVPSRQKLEDYDYGGISDCVMMTSRDGRHWDRHFMESFIKPGRDRRNWTQRNLIVVRGIVETGDEFSMYVNENYAWDSSCLRRVTMPKYRFGSVYAPRSGGSFVTKPFVFEGDAISLNYATSAPGSVRVRIEDAEGAAFEGFDTADSVLLYGDELEEKLTWKERDVSSLKGQTIRLRFELVDADVYAFEIK